MATMNGLLLVRSKLHPSTYYCTYKDGVFTDGHYLLKEALTCTLDWVPSLDWDFTTVASTSLIKWDDS